MPDHSNNTNQQSSENHGQPRGQGQTQGDPNSTPVRENELTERLADEYTEDGMDQVPPHLTNNPNRNLDKPDIDKPPYS